MSSVLQWNAGSEAVAEWGLGALYKLTINHPENQLKCYNAGACEVISRTHQKYVDNENIALAG
eukprot:CAMPEP_0182434844 /NCGR_PEP_ID=MMETSP1167-20130531/72142_1 /TAXON_ID=2988 /ORGANISM="Mallomonas Sp, Strain CCMP3275" /LENGTH=62 /DNA_ID=CAMNT_0024625177 /DNA_START=1 /DNA_END=186 /DNA_ORIENTATION=-